MIKNYWNKGGKQKGITILVTIVIIALLFFLRDDYQPALLFFRKFIFIILLSGLILFFGLRSVDLSNRIIFANSPLRQL